VQPRSDRPPPQARRTRDFAFRIIIDDSRQDTAIGPVTPHELLALRWADICNNVRRHDFQGKLELNAFGVIETSLASKPAASSA
jgi:hypothetical protein